MRFIIIFFLWQITTFSFLGFSLYQLRVNSITSSDDKLLNILHSAQLDNHYLDWVQNINIQPPSYENLEDIRILALQKFLKKYNSLLYEHAFELVRQADMWGLDYALLPAIAMQESQGCKRTPANSYNCWGFGIYGDRVIRFASYPQAIARVAKTIREGYINNELTNATLLEDRWAPPSKGKWSYAVNYFISQIHQFEKVDSLTNL